MSKPTIEEILAPKPEARPRIYAYSIADAAHQGLLKVGQTTRDVQQRVAEQLNTATIKNHRIELDESAEREDGSIFSDHEVRAALLRKGFENVELEWMRCSLKDVQTVLTELRTGQRFAGTHHETFPMRHEQAEAVDKSFDYYQSIWAENQNAAPRFFVEREDAFRQDLHRLPVGPEAGCPPRAGAHLQAGCRGCMADGP